MRTTLWVGLALLLAATPVSAQTIVTGQSASGAYFQIAVPDGWTPANGLVIWNHGFSLSPLEVQPDLGPLAQLQLAQGYAVAASSYSQIGWALFATARDNRQLVREFEKRFGKPESIIVTGGSLGGIVTAQAIEIGRLGNVVGALPVCGALAGSRLWDGALDLRLLYDVVCSDVAGAAIPGGANGLPFPPDPAFDQNAMAAAVNACTGVLQPAETRTPEQAASLDKLLTVTQLPENFLLTVMGFATFGLADLVYDPAKLGGGMGIDNSTVDYGDADVNTNIQRVTANQDTRNHFMRHYTPSGKVGDTKIVSIHTDKDGLVLVENESWYASVVPPENLTVGIIVEDIPTHCGFTEGETVAAWEALRGWVAGLPQPNATALQAICEGLVAGGFADGPCRYDPAFQVPDLDGRVRLRDVCVPDANTLCLGNDGRFRAQVAWDNGPLSGEGKVTACGTGGSGSFWFFDPENIELTVKVLDGRQVSGDWWVFYGSLTDVAFELTVTDTETGLVKVYSQGSGNFASVGDTDPF